MASQRIDITPEIVARLAEAAGLFLTPERCRELVPHVRGAYKDLAILAEVDVSTYEAPIVVQRSKPSPPRSGLGTR